MIIIDGTLKRRLRFWLLATVGVLGTFLLLEAYTSAQRAANRAFDSQLEAASLTIAEAIQWQDGRPVVEIPAAAFQILATDQQERVFYTILDTEGREVTGNLEGVVTDQLRVNAQSKPVWQFVDYQGAPIRLYGREHQAACMSILDEHGFSVELVGPAWWRPFVPDLAHQESACWLVAEKQPFEMLLS